LALAVAAAVDRYLLAKARKRSVAHDRRLLGARQEHFGADKPLAEITTGKVSAYRDQALARRSPRGSGEEPDPERHARVIGKKRAARLDR